MLTKYKEENIIVGGRRGVYIARTSCYGCPSSIRAQHGSSLRSGWSLQQGQSKAWRRRVLIQIRRCEGSVKAR